MVINYQIKEQSHASNRTFPRTLHGENLVVFNISILQFGTEIHVGYPYPAQYAFVCAPAPELYNNILHIFPVNIIIVA